MERNLNSKLLRLFLILSIGVISVYLLITGKGLLIPLVIAILFSIAIVTLSNFFRNLFYKIFKKNIPSLITMILSWITFILIIWLVINIITTSAYDLIKKIPEYQISLKRIFIEIFNYFNVQTPSSVYQVIDKLDLATGINKILLSIKDIVGNAGVIFFYVLFILLEYRYIGEKFNLIITNKKAKEEIEKTFHHIAEDMKSYFFIKLVMSFFTGLFSYFVMRMVGLDFALFWAFIIFIGNFIPTIGSIIAPLFPIILSLIQPEFGGTYYVFVFTALGLTAVQLLFGNMIEPRFMGNKLNLSPLVIIISLGFWGSVWGIVGMLLCVPIMVIINIILAKFESTRPIAILLSEKGELRVNAADASPEEIKNKIFDTIKHTFPVKKNINIKSKKTKKGK